MRLYLFVLIAMHFLAPGRDHTVLADAIARVVASHAPLYKGDEDRTRTAALVVAIAYREGTFDLKAIGDNGSSFCTMQINASVGGSIAMTENADLCVEAGFRILEQSARVSRENPVAYYARGPRWESEKATRISRDRVAVAREIRARVISSAP